MAYLRLIVSLGRANEISNCIGHVTTPLPQTLWLPVPLRAEDRLGVLV